ncbi:MAG: aldehyde dehydrogenase [Thermoplasmata archaeon]
MAQRFFINGEWVESESGESLEVWNPTTEEVVDSVPQGSREDAKRALDAASEAQTVWEDVPAAERAKLVLRWAELIEENREAIAQVLTAEEGKPLKEARDDVNGAAVYARYYASLARQIEGEVLPAEAKDRTIMILRVPVGVVAGITPWNFPAAMVTRKAAPALVAGDGVVLKPSTTTPLTAIELVKLAEKAGVPKGLLNLVTGRGSVVGDELVRNPKTQLVTMTGSVEVGQTIMESASENLTNVVLELGGKAPFIIWKDANLEWAVRSALWARYWNAGQTCICNERTYIQEEVYDAFKRKYLAAVKGLRIGKPTEKGVDMGPLVSPEQRKKVEASVQQALDDGAKLLVGGTRPEGGEYEKGNWFLPTVLEDVEQDMDILQQEIFGPVTPLSRFDDLDQVLDYANDSQYGLASYMFTQDLRAAMKAAQKLRFGETFINQVGPETVHGYHAGFRKSGVGGDGSLHGFEHYFSLKTVYLDYSDAPEAPYIFPYE